MCNYAVEVDVKNNKGLNSLCRASWLLDHDMFEVIYAANSKLNFYYFIFYFYL